MHSDNGLASVVAYLPLPASNAVGLGLLADLRGVVAMAKRRHPQLADCRVVDVGIYNEGDRVRATVVFQTDQALAEPVDN